MSDQGAETAHASGAGGGPETPTRRLTAVDPAAESAARRDQAVRAAVEQGLVGPAAPIAGLLDITGIRASAAALRAAFDAVTPDGTPVLHAFAVKASPLVPVLRLLRDAGIGAEVASPGELAIARAAGCRARAHGPRLARQDPGRAARGPRARHRRERGQSAGARPHRRDDPVGAHPLPVGLRVNPQIGGGSIGALSTATATSKFGVGLRDEGAREWIVQAYLDRPWLTRLHAHSGSQGLPLELMVRGVAATYELAEEINERAGRRQIDTIDIGGGLPVNFGSDEESPTHAQYARRLKSRVPGLLDGRYGLVTEFGRSLLAKHGTILARVEYAKSAGARPIAVTHAGVQVAARTVYAPASWPLRIAAYDTKGRPKSGPPVGQDIAGPACFAGDLLAENRPLPLLEQGDYAAALDTGAYYFAHHYSYNSLARPGIYGFSTRADEVRFAAVREPQTLDEIVAEAGGGIAREALRDL